MLYVILGISLLFVGVGYLVTEKNAKYLLSGYNTMSKEEQEKVDLKGYIPFFKKFHINLGASFAIIGSSLHYFYGEKVSGIFLGLYPLVAYTYFIWKSQAFSKGQARNYQKAGIVALIIAFVVVGGLFIKGFQELNFSVSKEGINIEGMYGEFIPVNNIESISLVEKLPSVKIRSNGFSLGGIHKGYYKTEDGTKLKLLLDSNQKPVIYIDVKNGNDIYYSAKETSNNSIYGQLKNELNSVTFTH